MTCSYYCKKMKTLSQPIILLEPKLDFVELIKCLGFMIQCDPIPGLITSKIFNVIN